MQQMTKAPLSPGPCCRTRAVTDETQGSSSRSLLCVLPYCIAFCCGRVVWPRFGEHAALRPPTRRKNPVTSAVACASGAGAAGCLDTHGSTPVAMGTLTARRNDTDCSCDLSPYILVTACLFLMSDLAITCTEACGRRRWTEEAGSETCDSLLQLQQPIASLSLEAWSQSSRWEELACE